MNSISSTASAAPHAAASPLAHAVTALADGGHALANHGTAAALADAGASRALDATIDAVVDHNGTAGLVVLDSPIQRGEVTITQVQLRKPDAGSLRGIKLADLLQMDVGAVGVLLPRISTPTLTTADVNKLDPADLLTFATEVSTFFLPKKDRSSLRA